jgi:hypothetical protein
MNTQTEAERLADELTADDFGPLTNKAAAELRRQEQAIAELLEALKGTCEFLMYGADNDPSFLKKKLKAAIAKHSKEQA